MTVQIAWIMLASACCAQERILWHDPGKVERVDFGYAAGGPKNTPRPPFSFVKEDLGGTNPKILVRDSAGVEWRVKGGFEVKAESFVTRLVSALGYYAEPTSFIARGRIEGRLPPLKRAKGFIHPDGSFAEAAFERRDPSLKYLTGEDWAWDRNPFAGTRELKGLKVLVMLVSNWDNKDVRDKRLGSNTGILERRIAGRAQWLYFVNDWGQTMGAWGRELKPKGWSCVSFTEQTRLFLQEGSGHPLNFGFTGQHTDDFKSDITAADIRWLMRYLGRITDTQIERGLKSSGATPLEVMCFGKALRQRINQLQQATTLAASPAPEESTKRKRAEETFGCET
jgi:hypothetical protein